MSSYRAIAFNPATHEVEEADWLDNHFGRHIYGVQFRGNYTVWYTHEVGLEAASRTITRLRSELEQARGMVEELSDDLTALKVDYAGLSDDLANQRKALDVAAYIIMQGEPGDSRAVSDEAVAICAAASGDTSEAVMSVINRKLAFSSTERQDG